MFISVNPIGKRCKLDADKQLDRIFIRGLLYKLKFTLILRYYIIYVSLRIESGILYSITINTTDNIVRIRLGIILIISSIVK